MLQKSEAQYKKFSQKEAHAHPRLVSGILNYSSWTDTENLHDMWAGLLASSCTPDGKDESNLIFINTLSQLTSLQARIFKHSCESAEKAVSRGGWLHILFEAPLYIDIKPFYPLSANPFLGMASMKTVCSISALLVIPALVIYLFVVFSEKSKVEVSRTKKTSQRT